MATKKQPRDLNALAASIVKLATSDPEPDLRNPHAVAMSKIGSAKGGHARATTLSPERRRAIAEKAAASRWKKPTPGSK